MCGLPRNGGNGNDDLPTDITQYSRIRHTHRHVLPNVKRESNELQVAKKKSLAKPSHVSSQEAAIKQSSMQHPVSLISNIPTPPQRNELPLVVNNRLRRAKNSVTPAAPVCCSSSQTQGSNNNNNNESQSEWQTHSIARASFGSSMEDEDDNKFEDISDHEALLIIQ